MDLSTLERNLKSGMYHTSQQFHQDVVKIFNNSYIFNEAYDEFIKITQDLERYYYRISGEHKPTNQAARAPLPPSRQQKKKKKPPTGSR
jgi:hypothetical protein